MTPRVERIHAQCPELAVSLVEQHIGRLDRRYLDTFTDEQIARHVRAMSELTPAAPVRVIAAAVGRTRAAVTIIGPDYPSVFSSITGLLTSVGLNILSGEVFTYRRDSAAPQRSPQRRRIRRRAAPPRLPDRRIVDHFVGRRDPAQPLGEWAERLQEHLNRVVVLLEQSDDGQSRAKQMVNEMVAGRLQQLDLPSEKLLLPMELTVSPDIDGFTRLRVAGQDTPAFLYALSSALSFQSLAIERVSIQTTGGSVEDQIDILDRSGNPIHDEAALGRIKLSALLTKQFTYFLGRAPDPYGALCRFENLVTDIVRLPEQGRWVELLSSHRMLGDLARLLGASEFIWEDFVRSQYETLIPMLGEHVSRRRFATPERDLQHSLAALVRDGRSYEEKIDELNALKDREIFLIDLEHILSRQSEVRRLAARLTRLAEMVVGAASTLAMGRLAERYGTPKTVAGLEAHWAVFGLGKFGGAALGYASDIELLFVYGDNGDTTGPERITNAELFELLVEETVRAIRTKREGIFTVDLRLRPYGSDGPRACSLENFCRYYGPGGSAHSYERLALVRLRAVAGDKELGARVERLRDEFVYSARLVDLGSIRELRHKQFHEKSRPGMINAKYSPGALVDLEYDVQLLQAQFGRDHPELRTPRTHDALQALVRAGVLASDEAGRLSDAYDFLRTLINGLRMLRGSAKDLFLPPLDSSEYTHLARRMGYERNRGLTAARQLHIDLQTHTAAVRLFVERHFGRDSLPGDEFQNVADLVLADTVPQEDYRRVLKASGFADPDRAYRNLRGMAHDGQTKPELARLAVLATDILRHKPEPDMALNNWERFTTSIADPQAHYRELLSQPMRLELLLSIFATSQFLADTLIRNPAFLDWATRPQNVERRRPAAHIRRELAEIDETSTSHEEWLGRLRRFRKREVLRIGTRDICLRAPIETVTVDISRVAAATIDAAFTRVWQELYDEHGKPLVTLDPRAHLCIMAFGKLGGTELNYSSDIDLMIAADNELDLHAAIGKGETLFDMCSRAVSRMRAALSEYTEDGYVFRVDLRLRPYGRTGLLVYALDSLVDYYRTKASPWELQALLKLSPVAGNLSIGRQLVHELRTILPGRLSRDDIVNTIRRTREQARKRADASHNNDGFDVKDGRGGIRDIEFLVQGLQLVHLPQHRALHEANTLRAVGSLRKAGILSIEETNRLRESYIFLRRLEHFLQLLDDRQTHVLPHRPQQLTALARRLIGLEATADTLRERIDTTTAGVLQTMDNGLGWC
ncbi:MAG: glutamate-ammonia-ligase adenylyltransferase [Chitinivibrionales bacterium]|nr:glutamate-ammonia-ligase adenylyltransferase [Chitinivibrionales bacterium]